MMENVVPMPRIEYRYFDNMLFVSEPFSDLDTVWRRLRRQVLTGPGTKISKPEELDTGRWVVRGYRRHREDGTWVWHETKMFVVMAELVIDP